MKKKFLLLIPIIAGFSLSACDQATEILSKINSIIDESASKVDASSPDESKPEESPVDSGSQGGNDSGSPISTSNPDVPGQNKPHPWIDEAHKVEIRWDNTFSYTGAIEMLISKFNELEPNITVTSNKKSGGYDLLESDTVVGFASGDYANIVTCYPDHVANYIDYGKAINFDTYIKNSDYGYTDEELDDFVTSYIDEGKSFFEEGIYVMPQSKSTEPMYYNAKILGVTIDGVNGGKPIDEKYINSLTWEELFGNFAPKFVEYNKTHKLIKLDPSEWGSNKFGGVLGYDSDDNLFITMCQQRNIPYTSFNMKTGYGSIDFDNPQAKALIEELKGYYEKGYLFTKGTCDNYTNYAFTASQCLFTVGSTGGLKYQISPDFETRVALIPQSANGVDAMISQGPGVCILDKGNEYENLAAWAFIKFLNEPNSTKTWASETGYAPTRYSVYEDAEYMELCDPTGAPDNVAKLTALILGLYDDCKDYLFVSPAFKGSSTARKQAGGIVTNALLDKDGHYKDANGNITLESYRAWLDQLFSDAVNTCKKAM